MTSMSRRDALKLAAAMGASLAWRRSRSTFSALVHNERRDLFPEGVASGDPHPDSVLLWTRRPPVRGDAATHLSAQIAADSSFRQIVAQSRAALSAESDWTCRVLAAGLGPRREYWYRFVDDRGNTSRVGRTITAPDMADTTPVHFTFVSCQNVQLGACNAYRRMIADDSRRAPAEQLGFVMHLGDFVYELMWYPEDRPQGYYDRRIRDIVRYPDGEKHADFHVPTTVEGYRALYRAYLADPDLQDARARWPFVCMWDNHEFSWKGWQSQQNFGKGIVPAQSRKVAAAQAWWEYQPARVSKAGGGGAQRVHATTVKDAPLRNVDANGLGEDRDNLAAIDALTLYRTLRYGANVEIILTDNRSYRSEPLNDTPDIAPFRPKEFPYFQSDDAFSILDAGREYGNGKPPATIPFGGAEISNARVHADPGTILGARQSAWFLKRLSAARAPWKLWGNSVGSLDWRTDLQNLPSGHGAKWPSSGYGLITEDDWSAYRTERNLILESVRANSITGFVSLAGDRHAFTAGLLVPDASARVVCAGRRRVHHGLDLRAGASRVDRAQHRTRLTTASDLLARYWLGRCGSDQRRTAPWRAHLSHIARHGRRAESTRRAQSGRCTAFHVRGSRGTRIRGSQRIGARAGRGIRVRAAAHRAHERR